MTNIFCRVGNKITIKNDIIEKIPDNFDLYVEPFVGSAIIYLNMNLENKK
jgi:site-specific DNA-adenine methylase